MYKEIAEMYLKNHTYKEIAEKFGISRSSLATMLHTMRLLGLLPPTTAEYKHKQHINEIVKLYKEGKTYKEISETLKIPRIIVNYILTILHKTGEIPYMPRKTQKAYAIIDIFKQNNVFTLKDLISALEKEGIKLSYFTILKILDRLHKDKKIKRIDIKPLKGFLPKPFPNVLYYTDYDALANYLINHLNVINLNDLARKLAQVNLPDEVKAKIKSEIKAKIKKLKRRKRKRYGKRALKK
jgi:hypothetical protein